jgi:type VI secretion system lysozyme-like protein
MPTKDSIEIRESILERLAPMEEETAFRSVDDVLEKSITRNLEMLLNTRREEFLIPSEFQETAASIVNFGVPDLAKCGSLRSGPEQNRLCRWIEEAIRTFEPRLCNVTVRVLDRENVNPVLRFRVEAKAEFTEQRMAFELGLKRDSGQLAVLPGSVR